MRAIVVYGVSAVALVGLGIGSLFIGRWIHLVSPFIASLPTTRVCPVCALMMSPRPLPESSIYNSPVCTALK